MATYDIPPDLIELKRAFKAAHARCERIGATHPPAVEVAAGTAVVSAEQHAELAEARAERLRIVEELHAHVWWETVDSRDVAQSELFEAARH